MPAAPCTPSLSSPGPRGQALQPSELIPQELTVNEVSVLLDEQQGINRAQLDAERSAQLQPGAECACGE